MRIGLLGGSFNPAHQGHIYISKLALKKLRLNQIWWVPTAQNPLKEKSDRSYEQRIAGCLEITKTHPQIRVKDFHKDSFFTYDLVARLKKNYPQARFYWIMGDDNLDKFYLWKKVSALVKLIDVAVFARINSQGFPFNLRRVVRDAKLDNARLCKVESGLQKDKSKTKLAPSAKSKTKFQIFNTKKYELSSTEIRQHNR